MPHHLLSDIPSDSGNFVLNLLKANPRWRSTEKGDPNIWKWEEIRAVWPTAQPISQHTMFGDTWGVDLIPHSGLNLQFMDHWGWEGPRGIDRALLMTWRMLDAHSLWEATTIGGGKKVTNVGLEEVLRAHAIDILNTCFTPVEDSEEEGVQDEEDHKNAGCYKPTTDQTTFSVRVRFLDWYDTHYNKSLRKVSGVGDYRLRICRPGEGLVTNPQFTFILGGWEFSYFYRGESKSKKRGV